MEINHKHLHVLHTGFVKRKRKNVGKEVAAKKKLKVFSLHQVLCNYPIIYFRSLQR